MEFFEMPLRYHDSSLENCHQDNITKELMSHYARNPSGNLLFCGNSGSGKTYAACAILMEYKANKGLSARFVNASDLYLQWRDAVGLHNEKELSHRFTCVELLVLDDLGIRSPTDAFLDFIYSIVNTRYNEMGGTIFTTNLNSVKMLEKFGESLTSRIICGKIIRIYGKDKRIEF
jgi:DNA replication protein DnaC